MARCVYRAVLIQPWRRGAPWASPVAFGTKKAFGFSADRFGYVGLGGEMKKLSAMGRRQVRDRVLTNLRAQAKAAETPETKPAKPPRVVTLYF